MKKLVKFAKANFLKLKSVKPKVADLVETQLQAGKLKQAIGLLRLALSVDPRNPKLKKIYARVLLQNVREHYNDGAHNEALELFQSSMDYLDENGRVILVYATLLYDQLRVEESDRVLTAFLDDHPTDYVAINYSSQLMRRGQYGRAQKILRSVLEASEEPDARRKLTEQLAKCMVEDGDVQGARTLLENAEVEGSLNLDLEWINPFVLAAEGKLVEAICQFTKISGLPPESGQRPAVAIRQGAHAACRLQTAQMLNAVPISGEVRGLCVVVSLGSPLSLIWKGLAAAELRKHGYATIVLERSNDLPIEPTGIAEIDELQSILDHSKVRLRGEPLDQGLRYDWKIDPDNGEISVEGINIYQPIRERISTIMRRYTVDFSHPLAQENMQYGIKQADAALLVCEKIHKVAKQKNLSVRFLGSMGHYSPSAVYKLFSQKHKDELDIGYCSFKAAYEHYFSNFGNVVSSKISVNNITRHENLRMSTFANKADFNNWIERIENKGQIVEEVGTLISMDRARIMASKEASTVLEKIKTHRADGGSVLCLFGKVPYDIAVEIEGGNAHKDMLDWIQHSMEAVRGRDDLLLLIKPHPNEYKQEIATPSEHFMDLVGEDLPENVILLKNDWFNINELLPFIDLGLVWHGTASLELQAKSIPVIVASWTGNYDHPIKFFQPNSRKHYEKMIREPSQFKVSSELRERCTLLLKYMGSEEMMIPYPYGIMPFLRRINVGPPSWHWRKVEKYLHDGDPNVELIAHRVLHGVSKATSEKGA